MQTRKREAEIGWQRDVKNIFLGIVFAALLCMLLLFGCAGLIANGVLQEQWMDGAVFASCILSTFGVGVIQHSRTGRWKLLHGAVTGAAVCLLFGVLGFLIWDGISLEQGRNILFSCLCGGCLAGILFGTSKRKRR